MTSQSDSGSETPAREPDNAFDRLIHDALEGDERALDGLIRRVHPWLLVVARDLLTRQLFSSQGEDLVQDTWQVFLKKKNEEGLDFSGPASSRRFLSYLCKLLHGLGLNLMRREGRRAVTGECRTSSPRGPSDLEASITRASQRAARSEETRILLRLVDALPKDQRNVFTLRIRGLANREVAREMGISPAAAAQRFSRARKAIRQALPPGMRDFLDRVA